MTEGASPDRQLNPIFVAVARNGRATKMVSVIKVSYFLVTFGGFPARSSEKYSRAFWHQVVLRARSHAMKEPMLWKKEMVLISVVGQLELTYISRGCGH
jgi:hypothetical protein